MWSGGKHDEIAVVGCEIKTLITKLNLFSYITFRRFFFWSLSLVELMSERPQKNSLEINYRCNNVAYIIIY